MGHVSHKGQYGTMMNMSTPYELGGRTDQKRRTRDALITAARELVASGVTLTVERAAQGASISRTTAYRYFPNQRSLLVAAHPEIGASSLLPDNAPDDVATRLDLVIDAFTRLNVKDEAQQRTMLRLSLDADPVERAELPLRQGRAIKWIEEALGLVHRLGEAADVRVGDVAVEGTPCAVGQHFKEIKAAGGVLNQQAVPAGHRIPAVRGAPWGVTAFGPEWRTWCQCHSEVAPPGPIVR